MAGALRPCAQATRSERASHDFAASNPDSWFATLPSPRPWYIFEYPHRRIRPFRAAKGVRMIRSENPENRLYRFSLRHPFLIPIVLLLIAVALRILDIFFLPLAGVLGEAIIHKAAAFLMVVIYLWAAGRTLRAIGLHGRWIGRAMFIGATGVAAVCVMAFALQWSASTVAGVQPRLLISAIDPHTGLSGGLGFALILVAGNVVNSFAEEGLFRGLMLTHFRLRLGPWGANVLQALIFGVWHLAWPLYRLVSGQVSAASSASQALVIVLGASISGLAYGYLYLRTDSLWAPWIAHTINNSVLNLVHIRTLSGMDADIGVLYGAIAIGYVGLILWCMLWAEQWRLPRLKPWDWADKAQHR
jgi:membrane protease YdiL (CAAX protease family)